MRGTLTQNLRCTPRPHTPRTSQIPREGVHHKSTLDFVSKLVSITSASAKIQTLEVCQGKSLRPHRAQLNLILRSEPGSFKSTILREVGQLYDVLPYSNVTYAAMIGTIDPNSKDLIPGLVAIVGLFFSFRALFRYRTRAVLRNAIPPTSVEQPHASQPIGRNFCNNCRLWTEGAYCKQCGSKLI